MATGPQKQSNKTIIIAILVVLIVFLCIMFISLTSTPAGGTASAHPASDNTGMVVLTIVVSILSVGLVVFFTLQSKLNKNRCPKCKMVNDYIVVREKELSHDAKMVTKKIQKKLRDTSGQIIKTTEEIGHVTVVDSVSHQQRKCKNCYHMCEVNIKKHIEY